MLIPSALKYLKLVKVYFEFVGLAVIVEYNLQKKVNLQNFIVLDTKSHISVDFQLNNNNQI